jgi:hypothetical protein
MLISHIPKLQLSERLAIGTQYKPIPSRYASETGVLFWGFYDGVALQPPSQ